MRIKEADSVRCDAMTKEEIVKSLHKMADNFGEMLDNPIFEGAWPTISITVKDDDGSRLRLTVGVESVEDEDL